MAPGFGRGGGVNVVETEPRAPESFGIRVGIRYTSFAVLVERSSLAVDDRIFRPVLATEIIVVHELDTLFPDEIPEL